MRKTLLLLFLTSFYLLAATAVFSQDDLKSTIIGNPSTNEEAMNLVADNSGNTYVGGRMENKGLIVKQNSMQQVLWSKLLSFSNTPGDIVSIDFLDVLADTVFGCGRIYQENSSNGAPIGIGSFYFKMNAQTGAIYWSKFDASGPTYLSAMRYANGRYFLVGGEYGANKRGRIIGVSSLTGDIIWQTPCINYNFHPSSTSFETIYSGATEMLNGKMYITGTAIALSNSSNGFIGKSAPILVGITQSGNIFLHRYFDLPSSYNDLYMGSRIEYDSDNNLVLGTFLQFFGIQGSTNSVFIKCDTLGAVIFSKFYSINSSAGQYITQINETPTDYTLLGYFTSTMPGMYAMKVSKTGTLQKCVSITKPNTFYHPIPYSSYWKVYGNSTFINGKHYFPVIESSYSVPQIDINKIILDENLDYAEDCSVITEIFPTTTNIPTTAVQLFPVTGQNPLTVSNGGTPENLQLSVPCTDLSLDLAQTQSCNDVNIVATTTGFTDPSYYWSNGASSDTAAISVNNTDTIFVRVLDTKCCELFDTIVPVITASSFSISLPNDTSVCLQNGASFTITPTFSGANGAVTYLWSTNSTDASLNVSQSGTYWVDISDNCSTLRDSILVLVNLLPVIGNVSDVSVCEGSFPVTLNPTISSGATVLWDNGTTAVSRSVNSPGSYTLSATNNCGTVNATIAVNQIDFPEVELVTSIDSCIQNGNSIELIPTVSGASSILWSDGSTANQLTISNSGTYTVYASNACGVDSAACSVTINHYPELNLPAVLDTCFEIGIGFSYTAQGSVGSYQWNSGSQTATEWISQEGIYYVTLTNQCGTVTDTMRVNRMAVPDLHFPEDSISYCQKQLSVSLLYIETNYELEILAPYTGAVVNDLEETGWYTIHAYNGCWDKWDSIYVDLQDEAFYLPNSFTPNGDSYNDRFEFEGENVMVREIQIYNRWGEEIFKENGKFEGWDGTYLGENCPDGIYVVRLVYEDCFAMPTEITGHVNLIR